MSAPANCRAGLSRLNEAIAGFMDDRGVSHVARLLGLDRGTVGDKRQDPTRWRVSEVLILAEHSEAVAGALMANVRPAQTTAPRGEAVAVIGGLMDVMGQGGETVKQIVAAVSDGRVSAEERPVVDAALFKLEALISKARMDLAAQAARA